MADIPTPRSYSQILGNMVNTLLARIGLPSLKVGSPALSVLEAAARSDVRNTQETFKLLDTATIDRATGQALDKAGNDEGVPRIGRTASTGQLTITDSSFTKVSSNVYQGTPAPIIGTTVLYVEDASAFASSGSLYIGRGTPNYEGPIAYSSKTQVPLTNYWSITLTTGTSKFHNLGESVVMAQGGNRTIQAGTLASTLQGTTATAIQFSISFAATIPDGEVQVTNVPAKCQTPGSIGKVVANSIVTWQNAPFPGAKVTNPLPFSGGLDTEGDDAYRERIRTAINSRTKGTALAIKSGTVGITALDENTRVLSSSLVTRQSEPASLYIDDSTGYEEKTEPVAIESIVDSASGGEQYFQLASRPIAKGFLKTVLSSPFAMVDQSELAVNVGGVRTAHRFSTNEFRSIAGASAYEVVAAINGDPNLLWSARIAGNGTQVSIFAKADTNEQIFIDAPTTGFVDANVALNFPTHIQASLHLYRDDVLLVKDGSVASLTTKPSNLWGVISTGATLSIAVDGTPTQNVTINDIDFVNAGTGYVSVNANNPLSAWAAVFNYKISGITAVVSGASLVITSNRSRSATAKLVVSGGTLAAAMFTTTTATGTSADYTFDRNLGQIKLNTALSTGSRLTAGTLYTRGFLETPSFSSIVFTAEATSVTGQTGAELWAFVDAQATKVVVGVSTGSLVTISLQASPAWGKRVRVALNGVTPFINVRVGDWLFGMDDALSLDNKGAYRIIAVDTSAWSYVEIEQAASWASPQTSVSLLSGGIVVARTVATYHADVPQRIYIPYASGAPYTALGLANAIQPQLSGAVASVFRTTRLRLTTNTYGTGDIAIVATNVQGARIGFPISDTTSNVSHLASVLSTHPQGWTPQVLYRPGITTVTDSLTISDGVAPYTSGDILVGLKTLNNSPSDALYGNDNFVSTIDYVSGTTIHLRKSPPKQWLTGQRFEFAAPYSISARDQLGIVVDGDQDSKRYVMNMYRKVVPTTSTYGITNIFRDADNANAVLTQAFGNAFDWTDFAAHMKARVNANGILWRYYRHGPEGNQARLRYVYPATASAPVSVSTDARTDSAVNIAITLSSSGPRTISGIRVNTTYIGTAGGNYNSTSGNSEYVAVANLAIANATSKNEVRLGFTTTGTAGSGTVSNGLGASATVISVGTGYIVINSVGMVGTFSPGNNLTFTVGGTGTHTATTTQYGYATLTTTLPGLATSHGLTAGNVIWLQSTDSNFPTGPKTIDFVPDGTHISYFNPLLTTVATATGTLTVSRDSAGQASFSGATLGDIFNYNGIVAKTELVASDRVQYWYPGVAPTTVLQWVPITTFSIYPLNDPSNSTANIVATVGAATNTPVTGTVITPGTVSWATFENTPNGLGVLPSWYQLTDGVNYVRSTTLSGSDYQFTFKDATTAGLATGSDWLNDDIRLVPITATNVVNFLNTPAVGGLFNAADVSVGMSGQGVQITTNTPGSLGSVQVAGGTANGMTASVVGSASSASGLCTAAFSTASVVGLTAKNWVTLDNTYPHLKKVFTSATVLTLFDSSGQVTVTGTPVVTAATSGGANVISGYWQVEVQGRLVAMTAISVDHAMSGLSALQEGDWVVVDPSKVDPLFNTYSGGPANNNDMSFYNRGAFRIVRIDTTNGIVWFENDLAVEEDAYVRVMFFKRDSVLPGDKLIVNTSAWGVNNLGTWTVSKVNLGPSPYTTASYYVFSVDTSTRVPYPPTSAPALGTLSGLIEIQDGVLGRSFKRVVGISPTGTLTDVQFDTAPNYDLFNASLGTVMTALDKLELGGASGLSVPGIDGYSHYTGLVAEANKVVYGDETQSSTYPGIAAAGANINITGPLVRRIQVTLALRVKTGINTLDIQDKVRSAVASVVNNTGVGDSVAISDLISAAQSVNGVIAVTVLSPVYGSGNDIISIQPYEKPLVVNLEQDVQVSFVGV